MRRFVWVMVLALGACFSKPQLRADDDAGADDAPGDDAGCLPGDEPAPTLHPLALAKVSAGFHHTCAIDIAGDLWCWGENDRGQLGNRADAPGAVTGVPGLVLPGGTQTWTAVAAGSDHACGIHEGSVKCWGRNDAHQTTPESTGADLGVTEVPLTLDAGESVADVFAGPTMSCARTSTNRLLCWGDVSLGADNAGAPTTALALVGTDNNVQWRSVAIAEDHACALGANNYLYCWGANDHLQLGTAGPASRTFAQAAPRDMTNEFTSVSAAVNVTCATRDTGALVCFGAYGNGHLGNVGADSANVVVSSAGWAQVSIGQTHACARKPNGDVHCYGQDTNGALGRGTFDPSNTLPATRVFANAATISVGDGFSCALDQQQHLACWGSNAHGEIGTGDVAVKVTPSRAKLPVGTCEVVQQVVSGDFHTCALVGLPQMPGRAYCWGRNDTKQVTGTTTEPIVARPYEVQPGMLFTRLAAGEKHTCGLRATDGAISCWGDSSARQLGVDSGTSAPTTLLPPAGTAWSYVAAGSRASCGITGDGELWCWGDVPVAGPKPTPFNFGTFDEGGEKRWSTIALGSGFAVGTAFAPADPNRVYIYAFAPTACQAQVAGTSPTTPHELYMTNHVRVSVAAAQANGAHVCFHMNDANQDNKVTCLGNNDGYQSGDEGMGCVPFDDPDLPAGVPSWRTVVPGVSSVTVSRTHSCALDGVGRPLCWGENINYALGPLPFQNRDPAIVTEQRFSELSTGSTHTCGSDDERKNVLCWGENNYGDVGDGAQSYPLATPAALVP